MTRQTTHHRRFPAAFLMALACASATVAAAPRAATPAATDAVFVRVNGTAIPVKRLDAALAAARARGIPDTPQLRQILRAELISQELLRQAALQKKLDRDPLVIAARDDATTTAMIQRYLALNLKPAPITEDDVRRRFDAIVATLGETEYKTRVLAVGSEAEARQVLARIKARELTFEAAAQQYSLLPSKTTGGALDWVSFKQPAKEGQTQGLPLTLANALSSLPVGGITADPIALDGGYYLLQLESSRPTHIPALSDAAPGIRRALEAQELERATAALVRTLINAARVE